MPAGFWAGLPRNFTALAPMAGVTDTVFRQLCKSHGADVVYTEFVSVDAIAHNSKKTFEMMAFQPHEAPVVVQIFGKDPAMYRKAAAVINKMGFAGIDINFGCPAYKVVRNGGGVSLMRNPARCAELVAAAIEGAGDTPVSIKCRASINRKADAKELDYDINERDNVNDCGDGVSCGNDPDSVTVVDLLNAMKGLDLAAVMLHGRSYERPFDGQPDPGTYAAARAVFKGVLMANGGITTPELAKEVLDAGAVDGVGIARGAWGQPWLFRQVKEYMATGSYFKPDMDFVKSVMRQHAEIALAYGGAHGMLELRKHLAWYVKGFFGAVELRKKLVTAPTLDDINKIIDDWKE